jgi:hypothetical protein
MLVPLRIIWLVKSHILMGDRPMSGITTWHTHHQLKNISLLCLHAARPESWVAKITDVEGEVKSCC